MTAEALRVVHHGTISVIFAMEPDGNEVAVACDPGMAFALEEAISYGQRPLIEYEPWQLLFGRRDQIRVAVR